MSFTTADEACAEGERRDKRGDLDGAMEAFAAALKLDPGHGAALNYAGWLLTTRLRDRPGAMGQGLDLLRAAIAAAPDDTRPLYNFAEACAALSRPDEARPPVDAALARRPDWAELWNLRGWLRGVKGGDPKGGLDDLQQALRYRPWYGDAELNRARVALALADHAQAEAALHQALRAGCWRPAEAHHHLGGLCERRGHLRRALGHYRRAVELGAGDLQHEAGAGVVRCGNALLHRGAFFLHADEETRRVTVPREERRAPPLAEVLPRVRHALAEAPDPGEDRLLETGRAALMAAETCFEEHVLKTMWSDQSPALAIELMATRFTGARHDALRRLAEEVRRAWIELYEQLLAREEPDPAEAALAEIERRAGECEPGAVLADLRALATHTDAQLLARAALAERLGDRARFLGDRDAALELFRIAHADFAEYAAGATAGGEGMARMLDVNRLGGKLSELGDR